MRVAMDEAGGECRVVTGSQDLPKCGDAGLGGVASSSSGRDGIGPARAWPDSFRRSARLPGRCVDAAPFEGRGLLMQWGRDAPAVHGIFRIHQCSRRARPWHFPK
jgi:hypothetical protein